MDKVNVCEYISRNWVNEMQYSCDIISLDIKA
jgi:hypothetical protein